MFKNFIYILSVLTIFILTGCDGDGFTSSNSTAGGTSAKGPFVQGSSVIAYQLNDNGTRSATASGTSTIDNIGTYSLNSISWSGATEIVVSGNYFNENDGSTNQTAELSAIVNVGEGDNVATNINIFTNIAAVRIKKLMSQNVSIVEAKTSAQAMVVELFDLNLVDGATLESLDLTDGTGANKEANAELLRISAAISATPTLLAALEEAVEDGNVSSDEDGTTALINLGQAVNNVDMNVVAQNLETSLNVIDAPDANDTNENTSYVSNANKPVITTIPIQNIAEDSTAFDLTLVATDADVNSILTFTSATSNDTSLLTVSLSGTSLTITPKANAHGSTTITVVVSDGTYSDSETFSVVISPVNDVPELEALANITKNEDAPIFDVALNTTDVDGDTLTYTAISSDTSKATVAVNNSTLTVTPIENASGVTTITVTVNDGAGGTDSKTFTVTLTSINDIPVLTSISNITKNEDFGTFSAGTASATDIEGNTVTYSISSSNTALATASIGLGNSIQIQPQANANGLVMFTLTANDGNGGIATETFTLTLTPVNDVPTMATLNSEFRAYGTSSFNVTLQGADIDNEALIYTAVSADTSVATVALNGAILTVSPKNVGTTNITATVKDTANTTATQVMALTVSAKGITVTADTQSKVYGDDDPTLTYTVNSGGLESADSLTGTVNRAAGELVNSYATNIGTLANDNYAITFVPSQFSITKAPLTATVDASTKVYGEANPTFTVQFTGFQNSDDATVVSNLVFSTSADESSAVGEYDVSLTSSLVSNYEVTTTNVGILTVSKATLTVTADAQTKAYGDVDPTLTSSITTGTLINGDTLTGVLNRDVGENAGDYAINLGTLTHNNYDIIFVSDDLTISKINQEVFTSGNDINKTTASPSFTIVPEGGSGNGVIIYESSSTNIATVDALGVVTIVDIGTVGITAIKEGDVNHNEIVSTFTLVVLPISPNDLVLTPVNDTMELTWDAVADASNYVVHYAQESFGLLAVGEYDTLGTYDSETSAGNTHTISGLTNGTTYYVTITTIAGGFQSSASVELNNASSEHDTWLSSATSANVETSDNLNTLNGTYSSNAFPYIAGELLSDTKYMVGAYNTNDTSSDNSLFLYDPTTKTDLTHISTGTIYRPHLLHDISKGKVALYNNKAIVVDGKAWNGHNAVGTLDITTNAFTSSTIPSVDLKNSSSHMMSNYGFVEGDFIYMSMLYRNYIENPGIWIIRWDIVNNTFSHFDFTASVQANVGSAGFDDRAQFIMRGKDSDHLLVGVYSSSVYYLLELQISTQTVVNKMNINTITGDAGYYETLMYKGRVYMIPRSETGDTTGLKMVKVNIQNFIGELITIDEGTEKNAKRQENSIQGGLSQMPTGETGLFIPRNVTITGDASEKQFVIRLDLEQLKFDFISLDNNNFQNSLTDTSKDQIRFMGLTGRTNGQVIGAVYWKDDSQSDHNNVSLRNGAGIYHASGEAIASVEISGALVDPYIVGAVMYQDDNDNKVFDVGEPKSTATTASGEFTFSVELTTGKQIRIETQGLHEGVTFDAELAALVDDQGTVAIVSPLTTFTAKGLSTEQLAQMLNHAASQAPSGAITIGGQAWQIAPEDISTNPLSGDLLNVTFTELQSNPRQLIKLQASLTTYAMLKIFEGSSTLNTLSANELYFLGVAGVSDGQGSVSDGNGVVALLARNILESVSEALDFNLLNTMETNLVEVRTGLTQGGVANVNNVAPTPNVDMISKVAVSVIERLSTVAFDAANAESDENSKVTAALTAMGTFSQTIDAKIMELGMKLYGLKYASTLSPYVTPISSASPHGDNMAIGIQAAGNGATSFRFDASGNVVAVGGN